MNIGRIVAKANMQDGFLACGAFGRVYRHGPNKVYKEAPMDGTGLWLERCLYLQRKLGLSHPVCMYMPEVFSFRKYATNKHGRMREYYEAVMAKYELAKDRCPALFLRADAPNRYSRMEAALIIQKHVEKVIGDGWANDLHTGNVMWCKKRGWIVVDPSSASGDAPPMHPSITKYKRVAPVYGPQRRQ